MEMSIKEGRAHSFSLDEGTKIKPQNDLKYVRQSIPRQKINGCIRVTKRCPKQNNTLSILIPCGYSGMKNLRFIDTQGTSVCILWVR